MAGEQERRLSDAEVDRILIKQEIFQTKVRSAFLDNYRIGEQIAPASIPESIDNVVGEFEDGIVGTLLYVLESDVMTAKTEAQRKESRSVLDTAKAYCEQKGWLAQPKPSMG